MPMNRRELLTASVAEAAILRHGVKAFAAPAGNIQVAIDAAKVGAPITPLIFGGYMWGNATRNNPKLRSPWILGESLALARNISFKDRVKLDLRMEAFNVLNRVRWGGPQGNVSAANFGKVTTQGNTPRRMQLALRLTF